MPGFVVSIVLLALAGPAATGAQAIKMYRVAAISLASDADNKSYNATFSAALRELGYVEGRNLVFDLRYADGDVNRLPKLVDEVIAFNDDSHRHNRRR